MDRLNVSGGSPVCAEYWSRYGHGAVTLGDPPEQTSEQEFLRVISLATKSTGLAAHAAGLARESIPSQENSMEVLR